MSVKNNDMETLKRVELHPKARSFFVALVMLVPITFGIDEWLFELPDWIKVMSMIFSSFGVGVITSQDIAIWHTKNT